MTSILILLTNFENFFFQRFLKKTKRCSVQIERLPAHILVKPFYKVPQENAKKRKVDIKSEIKVENHDDLDDPIYKDSVSIHKSFSYF